MPMAVLYPQFVTKLLLVQSAITHCKHRQPYISSVCVVHLDIEMSIGCHGKPHVLRVGAPCILLVNSKAKKFTILMRFLLRVNPDMVMMKTWAAVSNSNNSVHQDLPSSGGNHGWYGEDKSTSLLEVDVTKTSCGYRRPGNRIATVATRRRRRTFFHRLN